MQLVEHGTLFHQQFDRSFIHKTARRPVVTKVLSKASGFDQDLLPAYKVDGSLKLRLIPVSATK